MADTEKTLTWSFPFKTAGVRSREVVDPQTCYDALAKARGGSYPLGRNGLWHGGVHFDRETATALDQEAVRCVADGEVIAYRIDPNYPTALQRGGEQMAYSTGFVLIKHCLSPPRERNSSITLAPPPSLTFYSLYMHLLSWGHYQQEPDKPRPVFWGGEPEGTGRVVVLNRPVAINATALIGHPGVFHTANDVEGGGLLHLEIFSCDDVPAFLDKCRAYASRLLESKRTLVSISKIASALVPHTPQINANNPPTMMMPRVRALPGFILPRAVLDNLPFDHKLSNTITHPGQRPFTIRWWHLKQRLADATGQRVSGWLAENTLFFDHYSPWDWAGFDCLRESTCHNEQLACHFQAVGLLSKTREAEYAALINKAIQGPIKTRLRQIIQGTAETIATHPLLTPELIRKALDNPHHAQAISQLIIHYESEWFWNPAKWNELDPLLGHSESDPNEIWVEEKKRIQKLAWWGELAGKHGINEDGKVWHFHPIGLISNFKSWKAHPNIFVNNEKHTLTFLELYDNSTIEREDYHLAAVKLHCESEAIEAVAATESGATGSYFEKMGDDKVPTILFERHYFHQLTNGEHSITHPDISNSSSGGYGRYSEQYAKLIKAYRLSPSNALKSASWGRFQIMGRYHKNAGYETVEDFVIDVSLSEKNHLKAFVNFIKSDTILSTSLRAKDWLKFARRYNGPAQQGYDQKMREHYESLKNKNG